VSEGGVKLICISFLNIQHMALIKCVECGKEISDQAVSCPSCGNPVSSQAKTPVLIEKTSKKWKIVKLCAWFLIISGWIVFFSHYERGGFNNPLVGFGFSVGSLGVITLIIGKFGAWWSHR